jgi:hypothetical protein
MKFDSFNQWNGFANAIAQQIMVMDYENDIRREDEDETRTQRLYDIDQTKEMVDEMSYRLSELTKNI